MLRHLLNALGIHLNLGKIKAIQQITEPIDVTRIKGFLGTINFYLRFILECAKESNPIIELTYRKRGEKQMFVWRRNNNIVSNFLNKN